MKSRDTFGEFSLLRSMHGATMLGLSVIHMFSPAAPLPGGYAKDVDIVIEAPANFEAAEEEETTETAPSDENTQ